MQLGWGALALVCLAAVIAWFWQDSLGARETANAAAMEACERLALQFLDGTVAFARLAFTRNRGGWVTLRRTYVFDYTANSIERRQGFVVLTGRRVETVGYAPGEELRAQAVLPAATPQPDPPRSGPAEVLNLEDWRSRRGGRSE